MYRLGRVDPDAHLPIEGESSRHVAGAAHWLIPTATLWSTALARGCHKARLSLRLNALRPHQQSVTGVDCLSRASRARTSAGRTGSSCRMTVIFERTSAETLETQLAQLERHGDVAVVHQDFSDAIPVINTFLSQSFDRGERCVYILGEQSEFAVAGLLAAHELDVRGQRARAALEFLHVCEPHRPPGAFDRKAIVAMTRRLAEQSHANGFAGLRRSAIAWNSPASKQPVTRRKRRTNSWCPSSSA
jgi:hypothetical protein